MSQLFVEGKDETCGSFRRLFCIFMTRSSRTSLGPDVVLLLLLLSKSNMHGLIRHAGDTGLTINSISLFILSLLHNTS